MLGQRWFLTWLDLRGRSLGCMGRHFLTRVLLLRRSFQLDIRFQVCRHWVCHGWLHHSLLVIVEVAGIQNLCRSLCKCSLGLDTSADRCARLLHHLHLLTLGQVLNHAWDRWWLLRELSLPKPYSISATLCDETLVALRRLKIFSSFRLLFCFRLRRWLQLLLYWVSYERTFHVVTHH